MRIDLFIEGMSNVIAIFVAQNIAMFLVRKTKLHKTNEFKGKVILDDEDLIQKLRMPKQNIEFENIDFTKKEFLIPFISKLKEYVSEKDLNKAYYNINTVNTKRTSIVSKLFGTAGSYDCKKNKLEFSSSRVLGHEFLHMASTIYDEKRDIFLTGFKFQSFGVGLNEGYTDLLAARIYNIPISSAYKKLSRITKLIELFFDDPKEMTHLYFNNGLPELIKQLEQFAPKDDVIKLITDMDTICDYSAKANPFPTIKSIQIQLKLWKWFSSKVQVPERLQRFRDLLCEDFIISYALRNQKISLSKDNPHLQTKPIIVEKNEEPISTTIDDTSKTILPVSTTILDSTKKEIGKNINYFGETGKTTVVPVQIQNEILSDQTYIHTTNFFDNVPLTIPEVSDSFNNNPNDIFLKQIDDFIAGLTDEQWENWVNGDSQYQESSKFK